MAKIHKSVDNLIARIGTSIELLDGMYDQYNTAPDIAAKCEASMNLVQIEQNLVSALEATASHLSNLTTIAKQDKDQKITKDVQVVKEQAYGVSTALSQKTLQVLELKARSCGLNGRLLRRMMELSKEIRFVSQL